MAERLFLIDDNGETRSQLVRFLKGDNEIIGEAGSLDEVKKVAETGLPLDPSVAIVDDMMPREGDGKLVSDFLREKYPGIRIISMSSHIQSYGDVNLEKSASIAEIKKAVSLS